MEFGVIIINKNRGWRGLAELKCYDEEAELVKRMVFSFSQKVWDDMQAGFIVIQDSDNYYIINFNDTDRLPKGQRSVLIKHFQGDVINVYTYRKTEWQITTMKEPRHHILINHFIENKNNHTVSDWNCIGIRVTPRI